MTTSKTSSPACPFTNTKDPRYLNIASLGDIHLGHNRTPEDFIIGNLLKAFEDNPETAALDLIVITGDIFDQQILLSEEDTVSALEIWVCQLLKLTAKYAIEIVIVRGTPRHDRDQSYIFGHLNRLYGIGASVHYAKRLSVWKLERYNATFLFVPDEHNADPNVTYADAVRAIRQAGLTTVNFAVMHGAFDYQFPADYQVSTHNSDLWCELVTDWIFIGHVHIRSRKRRILAAGSFDRLTFGEPDPKGHYRVLARGGGEYTDTVTFVENTTAQRYETIDAEGLSIPAIHDRIADLKLKAGQHLRILCAKVDAAAFAESELQNAYQNIRVVVKIKKDRGELSMVADPLATAKRAIPVDITPENAARLLKERLLKRYEPEHVERLIALLEGCTDG